jgi:hypothetical protein
MFPNILTCELAQLWLICVAIGRVPHTKDQQDRLVVCPAWFDGTVAQGVVRAVVVATGSVASFS